MLSAAQLARRKSLLRSRAAVFGLASVAAFLSRSPFPAAESAGDANASESNASATAEKTAPTLAPIPRDSRSPFACELLSRGEKARLAAEVRALHLADDHSAYMARRADLSPACTWLALIPSAAS